MEAASIRRRSSPASERSAHGGLADCEENALVLLVDDTPSWSAGKLELPSIVAVQGENLKFGFVRVITNAGGNSKTCRGRDCDTVGSWRRRKHGASLQRGGIQPSQTSRTPVCDQNVPGVCNHARSLGKAVQRCDMSACVVVDHLKAITSCMCNEYATSLWVECPMIERRVARVWYPDDASGRQSHLSSPTIRAQRLDGKPSDGEASFPARVGRLEPSGCRTVEVDPLTGVFDRTARR